MESKAKYNTLRNFSEEKESKHVTPLHKQQQQQQQTTLFHWIDFLYVSAYCDYELMVIKYDACCTNTMTNENVQFTFDAFCFNTSCRHCFS